MAPHAAADVEVEGVTDTSSVVIPDPVLSKSQKNPVFTVDDVLPHRQQSAPMPPGVAAFGSANMFKSKAACKKPKSKRWDHRITSESKARNPSSLKGAMKYFRPGMISLCGGLPSSDYFPFHEISTKFPVSPEFSEPETAVSGTTLSTGKHDVADKKSEYDLSIALNYGQSMGPPQMLRYVTEHTEIVHNPPYSDWEICMTIGSTSALDIALRMLAARGSYLITEEYTFSSAIETALPMGIKPLAIKMDADGMLATDLDEVLSNWDESARGAPKPFLIYTVPTGQNPTASTQPLSRRKEIYAVAEKHDLFILEDEPYYFLQMEPYQSGVIHSVPTPSQPTSIPQFLSSLVPSYLSIDTSGRVLRMDSFSKVLAPGSRTGWVTGAAQLIERFIRHCEVSCQNPSGFAMTSLYQVLERGWGHKGFLEWLMFIRKEYTRRRDVIVNACENYLPREIASWTAPRAGMFHWVKIDPTAHPLWKQQELANGHATTSPGEVLSQIEDKIFLAAVDKGVLLARGSWFRAEKGTKLLAEGKADQPELFFRMTFAAASEENITEAVDRAGQALREEFRLH